MRPLLLVLGAFALGCVGEMRGESGAPDVDAASGAAAESDAGDRSDAASEPESDAASASESDAASASESDAASASASDAASASASDPAPCADTRAASPLVDGPAGIMVQTHTVSDLCLLERSLEHVCRAHRSDATGRIDDLVLTDVVRPDAAGRPSEALHTEVLDRVLAHRHCFGNVFFGTIPEVVLDDPYGADIQSEASRWRWLNAARRVADDLVAYLASEAPTFSYHWYASYEANLNAFTSASYRGAYVALLLQHTADLDARRPGRTVLWSPTFWTDPASLGASARASLRAAISDFFARVPRIGWVTIQDHVGVSPSFDCGDALEYLELVGEAAPGLASLQINVEYFEVSPSGIGPGDPAELAARVRCYRAGGASLGASFDFRYWYAAHGH